MFSASSGVLLGQVKNGRVVGEDLDDDFWQFLGSFSLERLGYMANEISCHWEFSSVCSFLISKSFGSEQCKENERGIKTFRKLLSFLHVLLYLASQPWREAEHTKFNS